MEESVGLLPLPVEVASEKRAPVVAVDDAVWVEHGHDPYHEVLSQFVCLFGKQVADYPIEHVRCLRLSWMHSARYEYRLLLPMILEKLIESVAKASKLRTCGEEVVLVVFEKAFDFLLEGSFQKSFDPALGLVSLPC